MKSIKKQLQQIAAHLLVVSISFAICSGMTPAQRAAMNVHSDERLDAAVKEVQDKAQRDQKVMDEMRKSKATHERAMREVLVSDPGDDVKKMLQDKQKDDAAAQAMFKERPSSQVAPRPDQNPAAKVPDQRINIDQALKDVKPVGRPAADVVAADKARLDKDKARQDAMREVGLLPSVKQEKAPAKTSTSEKSLMQKIQDFFNKRKSTQETSTIKKQSSMSANVEGIGKALTSSIKASKSQTSEAKSQVMSDKQVADTEAKIKAKIAAGDQKAVFELQRFQTYKQQREAWLKKEAEANAARIADLKIAGQKSAAAEEQAQKKAAPARPSVSSEQADKVLGARIIAENSAWVAAKKAEEKAASDKAIEEAKNLSPEERASYLKLIRDVEASASPEKLAILKQYSDNEKITEIIAEKNKINTAAEDAKKADVKETEPKGVFQLTP